MVWGFEICSSVHSANTRPFFSVFSLSNFPAAAILNYDIIMQCRAQTPCLSMLTICLLLFSLVSVWCVRGAFTLLVNMLQCVAANCLNRSGVSSKKDIKAYSPTATPQTGRHPTSVVDCTRSSRRRIAFGCVSLVDSFWGKLFWQHFRS